MNYNLQRRKLLDILRENRANHRALYEEARDNYLEAAKKALQDRFDVIESGQVTDLHISMPVPEDHTRDYDRVIRMLEMDTRDTILLSDGEAKAYVEDQWQWRRAWVANTASYTAAAGDFADEDAGY